MLKGMENLSEELERLTKDGKLGPVQTQPKTGKDIFIWRADCSIKSIRLTQTRKRKLRSTCHLLLGLRLWRRFPQSRCQQEPQSLIVGPLQTLSIS